MLLRSSLGRFLAPAAALTLLGAIGGGCGGCDDSSVVCDADGNCQICDAYGCHDANPQPSTSSAGAGATGQGGEGNAGTGASAQGGGGAGTGGSATCDQAQAACACKDSAECTVEGTQCIGGLCVAGCDFSYQCGAGKVCDNGACVLECSETTACTANGYKCDKGVCVPDPQNPECSAQKPCEAGSQICVDGFCTTSCTTNTDCQQGDICDATTGSCIVDPSPKPVCSDSSQCTGVGQQCGADGYCHYPCTTLAECKLIADQFAQCDVVCKTQEEVSPECSLENPCEAGKDCISNQCL